MITLQDAPLLLARDALTGPRLHLDSSLHRVRTGVYTPRDLWERLPPWERYHLRVIAVRRAWTEPVFALESAAALQSLPLFGKPREIHLLDAGARSWREGDVVVHGSRDERALVTRDGCTMTSELETTVDLCRVLPPAFARAVADRYRRLAGDRVDLGAHARGQAGRRGLRQVDWVQAHANGHAESAGESVSMAVIEWLGYELPEQQVEFRYEGARDRVDMYWRRLRTIGESDGYGKYDASDVAASKAHFVREKLREDRLRRHEGGFIRWDWSDAMQWRPLDAKLSAGGIPVVEARQHGMLATLASNPRSVPRRNRG